MKLNDLNKLLDEGKVETAADNILEELGEVAAEPVATVEGDGEEVAPSEISDAVEDSLEADHVAEGETHAEVVVEELGEVAAEPVATSDAPAEEANVELTNKDVYNDKTEPEVAEAPGEVVVEDTLEVSPEAVDAVEAGNEDGVETPVGDAELEPSDDIAVDTVDIPEVDVETEITESMNSIFAMLKSLNEELGDAAAEPVATSDEPAEEVCPIKTGEEVEKSLEADHAAEGETPGVVVVEELGEVAAEPVATSDEPAEKANVELTNTDVYNDKTEPEVAETSGEVVVEANKVPLSALVDIITEAVKRCKTKGVKATKVAICEEAEADVKALMGVGEEPADKEYDVDAAVESAEMNSSDKFEKYEDIQGEGANAALTGLKETVKYSSLKEAYLLDEDYFDTDSYTIQTAGEKTGKLTEQLALMIARDNMDPLYDTLLKEAVYTQRLHEACVNKYQGAAAKKAAQILDSRKK